MTYTPLLDSVDLVENTDVAQLTLDWVRNQQSLSRVPKSYSFLTPSTSHHIRKLSGTSVLGYKPGFSSVSLDRDSSDDLLFIRGKGLQSTKLDDLTSCKPLLQSVGLHHSYSSNSTPLNSGRTSPTLTDHTITPGLSGLQGGWITGNSTERSSLGSSYSLDDIDRQASCTVTRHFDNIQCVLFEGQTNVPANFQVSKGSQSDTVRECQEWRKQFHHLRVLGAHLREPGSQGQGQSKDIGYQCIPRESKSSASPEMIFDVTDGTSDPSHVGIIGRGILPKHPPTEATAISHDHDTHNGFEFLQEEIFAQDGVYEEVIAIDDERIEDNVEPKVTVLPSRRRVGYPPITPNACITNSVMTRLFDILWREIIIWNWQLIQKEYPTLFDDVMQQTLDVNPVSPQHNNPSPASRQPSFTIPKNLYLSQRANTHAGGTLDSQNSFDGILQISRIPINSRDTLEGTGIIGTRPGSSIQRQRPTTTNRYTSHRPKGSRLPPLHASDKNKEDVIDVVLGKKIPYNIVESISPPPSSATYQRNGALPPLHMEKERKSFYRASSAIDNKDSRSYNSNTRVNVPYEQRPNTTHTMRSDNLPASNILRRSSTPLGPNSNKPHFIASKPLNVTGSGLQPSSDYSLSHLPPDIVEDHEGSIEDGILHNNHWPSTTNSSNNNPYRRRTLRYLVQT